MTKITGYTDESASNFVSSISSDVMESTAVIHPYLRALRDGAFPDVRLAYQDFAFQYGQYSSQFVRYISAVLTHLSNDKHRKILADNLAEEQGNAHDADLPGDILRYVDGKPHSELFRQFQSALGVNRDTFNATSSCPGNVWSRQFLALCESNEFVGIGAIGIGTELIVSGVYNQILEGLRTHSDLTSTQRVFFDLHSVCDEDHAAQMLLITEDLARDHESCEQIRFGVQSAINLRSGFWDKMLERALDLPNTQSDQPEKALTVGYQESL